MNQSLLAADISAVMPEALATGLFRSRCTIQAPDGIFGPSGAPSGVYANVAGLINIRCMDAPQPPSEIKLGAESVRAMAQVAEIAPRHVLLDNYYPALIAGWRYADRAIVDGTVYEICGAEADSQRTQTRLELKLVTAGAVQS